MDDFLEKGDAMRMNLEISSDLVRTAAIEGRI
jgi:hypothetical protein